ncbi:hypothetical protein [Parvicella tangerina]|uniref:Uncharacterized protein n=1 Tax=Parvicella tangerina TaxID=2829795 RepID=A0A916JKL4_9FLAO|nr:hypothetical protein [Parvicella tangerina]CAG5079107.1 hypothetical protein CRYO30217_00858 [Parvicella tangerina]
MLFEYPKYLLLFISLQLFASCNKKKDPIRFEFEIITEDYYTGDPLSDVEVSCFTKGVNGGTYNNTFQLEASEFTNHSGIALFNVEYGGLEVIKLTFDKASYFQQTSEYNPDTFSTNEVNTIRIPLKKKGHISIRIMNAFPISEFDEITFNSLNADCNECVKFNSLNLQGTAIDTTLSGGIVANRYFKYQYIVTKSGSSTNFLDSTYCDADTTFIDINY